MTDDPHDILGWQRIDASTTTSGLLKPSDPQRDPQRLAAIGVRRVINLALAESPGALDGEAELLEAAGVAYTHIPVAFDAPKPEQFAAFCAALESSPEPVHVHCVMNWRVSAFFYRYHRERTGMDEATARALMERQWSPETSTNKDAPTWARFIRGEST